MNWIKSLLPWMTVHQPKDEDNTLTILVGKEMQLVHPICVAGVLLRVKTVSGERVIGESQVTDRAKFWRVWRQLRGNSPPLMWEDGTPFEPPTY